MENQTTSQDNNTVLNESNISYRDLFNELIEGFALHDIVCNEKGEPINYRFLDINPAFERMVGFKAGEIIGKLVLDVMPHTEKFWIETYGHVALTGEPIVFEHYASEQSKYYQVTSFSPKKGQFVALFEDVTSRKEAEEKLNSALTETNKINDMMVGREMKMIELKNKIKEQADIIAELENKLINHK